MRATTGYAFCAVRDDGARRPHLDRDYTVGARWRCFAALQALMAKKHAATLLLSPFELQG